MTLHNPTTAGGKTEAKCTGHKSLIGVESLCPSMNVSWNVSCQIECVSSDSDTGMPCGKPAVAINRPRSRHRRGRTSNPSQPQERLRDELLRGEEPETK